MSQKVWFILLLVVNYCKCQDSIFISEYAIYSEVCEDIGVLCTDERQCITDIEEADCPNGTVYHPKGSLCGCCPGCIRINEGEECTNNATSLQCAPGYSCSTENVCEIDGDSCTNYGYDKELVWRPSCDPDGSFSAVQCKGDKLTGRCFCYSEDGERIFGQEWWKDAENMTCACSRMVSNLMQQGRTNITLHCSDDGNFEQLQCDSGVCWCADEKTGSPTSVVVTDTMLTLLPCYDATTTGTQYLRQCESIAYAQATIKEKLRLHGTVYTEMAYVNCDQDGSYGSVQENSYQAFCAWKDMSQIGSYAAEPTSKSDMSCYCARDTEYYAEAGFTSVVTCSGNGNYPDSWQTEEVQYCLDDDGFASSPTFSLDDTLECSDYTV